MTRTAKQKTMMFRAMLILIVAVVLGSVLWAKTTGCSRAASELSVQGEYRVFAGCFFTLPDGEVVPQENYRIIERTP